VVKHKDKVIGYLGCLNQKDLMKYKINQELYALVLNIQPLMVDNPHEDLKIKPLFTTLPVLKDITYLADKNTDVKKINTDIKALNFVSDYKYISAYKQENTSVIAYTIHLVINNNETLTKDKIDKFINQIVDIIKKHKGNVKGF